MSQEDALSHISELPFETKKLAGAPKDCDTSGEGTTSKCQRPAAPGEQKYRDQ